MTRRHHPLSALPAVTLLLAVAVAGCTGKPTPTDDDSRSPLKFSQCMRDQGLEWYPDPEADGGLKVSAPEGTADEDIEKAEAACRSVAPWEGAARGPIPAEDLEKIRQVSQCMRDRGFPKYPDPDADGSLTIDSAQLGADPDDPAFQKARQECDKHMPAPQDRP